MPGEAKWSNPPSTPYDAARSTIDRARALLTTADDTSVPSGVRADLRRLAVVMAVAALDVYMHRLIVARAYEHSTLPGGLAALTIRFEQLLAEADESVRARRADELARPRVRVKRILRDRLQRETFQRWDDVLRALAMAGKSGEWDNIARVMAGTTRRNATALRAQLDEFVRRRNAIVHEGDYERLERPQTARLMPLGPAASADVIDFFSDLIDAIHSVV